MLKSLIKRAIKSTTNIIRGVPLLLRLAKWLLSLSPQFESFARGVLISSFALGSNSEDRLSDAEIRVLIDLREAIAARQGPPA